MPIRLPKIAKQTCILLIVCAKVQSNSPGIRKLLKANKIYVSRVKIGGRSFVLSAILGDKYGQHFHVDLAALDFFGRKGAPKKTHSLADVKEAMEPLVGQTCEVKFEGRFQIPVADLPEAVQNYVRIATTSAVVGGVKIRTTGGTLRVDGAPVNSIDWWISKDKDYLLFSLEGRRTVEINESYLEDLWSLIQVTYAKLIERESANG